MVPVTMDARGRRTLRGSAAASFATFVALTSHVIGGGALPTLTGLIVPLALSTLVCVLLAGRQLSLHRLSISVLTSQALFHLLFSIFTPTASAPAPTTAVDRHAAMHAGHEASMASMGTGHDVMGSMSTGSTAGHAHTSPTMLIAHLVAAVVTIAMFYWAERLPAKLCDFGRLIIRTLLPIITAISMVPEPVRTITVVRSITAPSLGVLRSPVLVRGPPREAL